MQCGFAFLEVGCVRSKNVSNILMKTLLDSCKCLITSLYYCFCMAGVSEFLLKLFVVVIKTIAVLILIVAE